VGSAVGGAANPAQALAKRLSESFEGVFNKMKGVKKPGGHKCPPRPPCISNNEYIKCSGGLKEGFKPLDKNPGIRGLGELKSLAEKIYGGNSTEEALKLQDMMQQMQAAIAVVSSFMKKHNEASQQMMSHIRP